MIYLQLFWEFFQIGLFAVGGAMATIPFLQRLSASTGWFPLSLITDMVAVSEATPGPIGINMATYVGCAVAGLPGALAATLGEILPSMIIVVLVSVSLARFRGSKVLDHAFYGLRPAVTGLIAAACLSVASQISMFRVSLYRQTGVLLDLFDFKKLIYLVIVFLAIRKLKLHPILCIAVSAVIGVLLAF